jgi:hypothetical protein
VDVAPPLRFPRIRDSFGKIGSRACFLNDPREGCSMAFYEFTDDENVVFKGLSLRMNAVGGLMVLVGIGLIVFGAVRYPLSLELLLLVANGFILFGIGYLTFRSSKRFVKIIETEGHDIMYLMEAMSDLSRVYTLIVALIVVVLVFLGISASLLGSE